MDKAKLFERRLPEDKVEVEGVGTFHVRGLSREEAAAMQDTKGGWVAQERVIISTGCIDPKLSIGDVKAWQSNAPAGELEQVARAITRLSGLLPEQPKEETTRFPDDVDS